MRGLAEPGVFPQGMEHGTRWRALYHGHVVNMSVGMGISLFITNWGSLSDVGLYGMGYNLVFAYAGVVFTAVEADYFPRLSSVHADAGRMNLAINRQIKVCVLLMSPFLVLFMISCRWLSGCCIPLLFYR